MKIYIVTVRQYVALATPSREKAEALCRKEGGRYNAPVGHKFEPDDFPHRSAHFYKSARTGRWNKSDYVITETELEAGE